MPSIHDPSNKLACALAKLKIHAHTHTVRAIQHRRPREISHRKDNRPRNNIASQHRDIERARSNRSHVANNNSSCVTQKSESAHPHTDPVANDHTHTCTAHVRASHTHTQLPSYKVRGTRARASSPSIGPWPLESPMKRVLTADSLRDVCVSRRVLTGSRSFFMSWHVRGRGDA